MNAGKPGIFVAGLLIVAFQPLLAAQGEQAPCTHQPVSVGAKTEVPVPQEAAFESSYNEAECLRSLAAQKDAEWLKTKEILLLSREAADRGDWDEAMQLLTTARFQAETAIRQAEREASAWRQRVIGHGANE